MSSDKNHPVIYGQCLLNLVLRIGYLFVPGLCNGSTTDFDSVSLGSIPSPGAIFCLHSIMDNTLVYEAGDCGSIPYAGTNFALFV